MRKQILKMQEGESFPFCWVQFDSDSCIDVQGHKIEIYIKKDSVSIDDMKSLFCDLFGTVVDELSIFSPSWWDFCIDTWNIQENTFCYDPQFLSKETVSYLHILQDSNIAKGYSGCCVCNDWDTYLSVALDCIMKGIAPYGNFIYNSKEQFFFYFHHTGSIGLYYENETPSIFALRKNDKYEVLSCSDVSRLSQIE